MVEMFIKNSIKPFSDGLWTGVGEGWYFLFIGRQLYQNNYRPKKTPNNKPQN